METDLRLAAILGGLSVREGQRVDLPTLVTRWHQFARRMRDGDGASPDEYRAELGVRDLLADVIASLPSGRGQQIAESIQSADDTYREATRVVDNPRRSVRADRWWWTRIPAGLGHYTETGR